MYSLAYKTIYLLTTVTMVLLKPIKLVLLRATPTAQSQELRQDAKMADVILRSMPLARNSVDLLRP